MTSHRRTRFTVLINEYFIPIVLILALITAGGGWLTYTSVLAPGTHAEQRPVSSWQVNGTFNYSATAVNDTAVFDKGEVRSNRKFYITNTTPILDGTFNFQFEEGGGNATVETRARLVHYAAHKESGKRIWNISTPLTTNRQQLTAENPSTTAFTVNASSVRNLNRRLLRRHGSLYRVANLGTSVAVSARVNGTVDGERVQQVFNYTLPINSTKDYYDISSAEKPNEQVTVARREMVPNQPGVPTIIGSLASLLVPVALLAGLFYGRKNDWFNVSQTARAEAKRAKLRSEFEEWVTEGTVAIEDDRSTITIESLGGLVDVAIDSNSRVIEDTETGVYVVRDEDVWYQFTPDWATTDENDASHDYESDHSEPDDPLKR